MGRQMRRREFITLLGGATAWPLAARAQQGNKVWRIGFLGMVSASSHAPRVEALRAGLRELGYVEGKNLVIEFRWAEGHYDRLPALADELVRLNLDVILTHTLPGAIAVAKATTTIPIVITAAGDIVTAGLVSSLSRPGGNVTGQTFFNPELAAKRIELLKETIPALIKVAVLLNANNPAGAPILLNVMEPTAKALKVELLKFEARSASDLDRVFSAMNDQQIGAVVLHEDPLLNANAKAIADLAARWRLPTCGFPEFAVAGGLMAYGVNFPDLDHRAAAFVDKILKGAKPADLPIEQATRFRLIVNLKTAKAAGIEVPTSVLLRADEVIE
jgi:putative tryptophan/tyrosine transport system substrate-binding protein